jgi:hypothetical protein
MNAPTNTKTTEVIAARPLHRTFFCLSFDGIDEREQSGIHLRSMNAVARKRASGAGSASFIAVNARYRSEGIRPGSAGVLPASDRAPHPRLRNNKMPAGSRRFI